MASGDTKTNQYLDIAANGTRADLPSDTCCETRSQTLIREVAERVMDVEDEVEELKNNPDVVDIVATYADLQAYDTSKLTDKDVIRVLADETHSGDSTYYRFNKSDGAFTYIGESKQYTDFIGTDGTSAGEAGLVPAPATTDAGKFLKADGTWATAGGGGVTELTADDYNYPADNPNSVALWLLDSGWYAAPGILVRYDSSTSYGVPSNGAALFYVSKATAPTGASRISEIGRDNTVTVYSTQLNNGSKYSEPTKTVNVVQATGTSTTNVMSQKAVTGMVYADPTTQQRVRIGNGRETNAYSVSIGYSTGTSTGYVGGVWSVGIGSDVNIGTGSAYSVVIGSKSQIGNYINGTVALGAYSGGNITAAGMMDIGSSNTTYGYNSSNYRLLTGLYDPQNAHDAATKGYVDAQAGGVTPVQTTGTSTTDVMSQNAVTSMVFADPSIRYQVQIGALSAASGSEAIAIGMGSKASSNGAISISGNNGAGTATASGYGSVLVGYSGKSTAIGSVALGACSNANTQGQVDVGTTDTYYGYNNSNYRLLTGLYDGQSAHDAATVNQVNSVIDSINTALSTNIPHIGA